MRIVAGSLGGRVLRAPRGAGTTRPTSEKVRQAIFNLLGPPEGEVHALDLFAGSGALGLEALSRGAASATFVERDRAALTVLGENLAALGVGDRATVVASEVARALRPAPDLADPGCAVDRHRRERPHRRAHSRVQIVISKFDAAPGSTRHA